MYISLSLVLQQPSTVVLTKRYCEKELLLLLVSSVKPVNFNVKEVSDLDMCIEYFDPYFAIQGRIFAFPPKQLNHQN